jgi:hypothetical protein
MSHQTLSLPHRGRREVVLLSCVTCSLHLSVLASTGPVDSSLQASSADRGWGVLDL